MSFDKKIKEKLEGIRPEYSDSAWKNFSRLMPTPWYVSLFRDFGSLIYGGVATIALVGTGVLYFNQKTENERLFEEISTLKNQAPTAITDTVLVNSVVHDTVYQTIEKIRTVYVNSNQPGNAKPDAMAANSTQEGNSGKDLDNKEVRNSLTYKAEPTTTTKLNNNVTKSAEVLESDFSQKGEKNKKETLAAANLNTPTNVNKVSQIADTEKNLPTDKTEVFSANDQNNEEVKSSGININEGKTIEKSESVNAKTANTFESTKAAESTDKMADTETSSNASDIILDEPSEELRNLPEKKKIKLPKINTRVGLSTDYLGMKLLATGPTVELFLGKKFSFNAGLLISGQESVRDKAPQDFNSRTGYQFQDQFKSHFDRYVPQQISDITIKTSFLKMPLSLNYYISTWSRFSFMVSVGTKLDVKVFQEVDFKSNNIFGQNYLTRFENRPNPKVFNNFNYGTGVQYQYKNMVIQAMPYFDFNFRKTNYFSPPNKFGINASLKYQLGR